jgi:N-acetyltransferase 10
LPCFSPMVGRLMHIQAELSLPVSQVLALLVKVIRKISKRLVEIQKEAVTRELEPNETEAASQEAGASRVSMASLKPLTVSAEDELAEAGTEELEAIKRKEKQRELINSLDLTK